MYKEQISNNLADLPYTIEIEFTQDSVLVPVNTSNGNDIIQVPIEFVV